MFLRELGFLQYKKIIYFTLFSFRHPRGRLLEFSVDYGLLWYGFFNHVLKSYKHVFGRLKYTNTFKSILYHCFYPWLTDLSQSVEWGEFSMDGRILNVSFAGLAYNFAKVVASIVLWFLFWGVPWITEEGLNIVQKLWGSSLALRFLFSKAKLVYKRATNANSDCQVGYHSLET